MSTFLTASEMQALFARSYETQSVSADTELGLKPAPLFVRVTAVVPITITLPLAGNAVSYLVREYFVTSGAAQTTLVTQGDDKIRGVDFNETSMTIPAGGTAHVKRLKDERWIVAEWVMP